MKTTEPMEAAKTAMESSEAAMESPKSAAAVETAEAAATSKTQGRVGALKLSPMLSAMATKNVKKRSRKLPFRKGVFEIF